MRTNSKKQNGMILLAGVLFLIIINLVSATNIGISPASVNFKDVFRGGYAERTIVVSVDSDTPVVVHLTPRGDIQSWINFSAEEFNVSRNNPYLLIVSVSPPLDMPNGNYTGFLRFEIQSSAESIEQHAVGTIRSTLDLAIKVGVTDIEITKCTASGVEIFSAEKGDDIVLKMNVTNEGNIRLKPEVSLDVWDSDKISIIKSENFLGDEVLPSTKKELEFRFDSESLAIGQYWSDAYLPDCLYSGTFTFDVLEPGTLSANGVLLNILTPGQVNVGDTTVIKSNFKNTGEKEIDAQFRGQITKDGKVVDILESPSFKVPVSNVEEFDFYFTPESAGKYIITGRVFYEGKKTFELSSTLDAVGNTFNYIWTVYVFFVLVIGFLFYRIRKEKRIYLDKLRRIK